MECLSLRRIDDFQKLGNSVVSVDFPSKIDVGCVGKTSKVTDDSQEDVITRKSTRLKILPIIRKQDFLW